MATRYLDPLSRFAEHAMESTEALGWPGAGGVHTCQLCGEASAGGNFAVPAESILFVAPELAVHYVSVHHYLPPSAFLDSLLSAPLPGTSEYLAAVSAFRR